MKPDKMQKLIDSYPMVFSDLKYIECSDGWYVLLDNLCSIIEHEIKSLPLEMQEQIYAIQIKSKYGGLRAYFNHTTPKIDGAIDLAEELSNNMCEVCGNFGGHKSINGWIIALCNEHYEEELARVKPPVEEAEDG